MNTTADPRIAAGMRRQLDRRATLIASGDGPLGWKAGFGTAAAMAAIGTDAPLAGFLTKRSLLAAGAEVDLAGWTSPAVEVELAARLGADLPGGATPEQAAAAIDALAPAFELVDLADPWPVGPEDVETVLAGDIFHRHVVLGSFDERRTGGATDGIAVTVQVGHARPHEGADPRAATGEPADVVRAIAGRLAEAGERLRAGDIVIAGAVVPPFPATPGDHVVATFDGLGEVAVRFAP